MQRTSSQQFNDLFKKHLEFDSYEPLNPERDTLFDSIIKNNTDKDSLLDLIDRSYINQNSLLYKVKYESLTGLTVPNDFQVHHIDINRENAHISNLVALPSKLHIYYHHSREDMLRISKPYNQDGEFIMPIGMFDAGGSEIDNYQRAKIIQKFVNIQQECCLWVSYRNALLGINNGCPVNNYKKI